LSRILMPVEVSRYIALLWLILTPLLAFIIATALLPTTRAWIRWPNLRTFRVGLK
jgi:phosphate/sulfate permease